MTRISVYTREDIEEIVEQTLKRRLRREVFLVKQAMSKRAELMTPLTADNRAPDDMPMHDLERGVRLANILANAQLDTVGKVCSTSERELRCIRGFGRHSLRELRAILACVGRDIGDRIQK